MIRLTCLLAILLWTSQSLAADVHYQSAYLNDAEAVDFAILGETNRIVHRIGIDGTLGGKGKLHLDGNLCTPDSFGDPGFCTEVFYAPLDVDLVLLPDKDPADLGRSLYAINVAGGEIGNFSLRLVVPSSDKAAPRLLLNSHLAPHIVLRTVTLESSEPRTFVQEAPRQAATKEVRIKNFAFDPPTVTINAGDSVKWTNDDGSVHTATRTDAPAFDTGNLAMGESKEIKFTEASGPGGFEYFCSPHPFMKGRVVVTDGSELKQEGAGLTTTRKDLVLAGKSGCLECHDVEKKVVGPAYSDIAARYKKDPDAIQLLVQKIKTGGKGNWTEVTGGVLMPPHSRILSDAEVKQLAEWVLRQ